MYKDYSLKGLHSSQKNPVNYSSPKGTYKLLYNKSVTMEEKWTVSYAMVGL